MIWLFCSISAALCGWEREQPSSPDDPPPHNAQAMKQEQDDASSYRIGGDTFRKRLTVYETPLLLVAPHSLATPHADVSPSSHRAMKHHVVTPGRQPCAITLQGEPSHHKSCTITPQCEPSHQKACAITPHGEPSQHSSCAIKPRGELSPVVHYPMDLPTPQPSSPRPVRPSSHLMAWSYPVPLEARSNAAAQQPDREHMENATIRRPEHLPHMILSFFAPASHRSDTGSHHGLSARTPGINSFRRRFLMYESSTMPSSHTWSHVSQRKRALVRGSGLIPPPASVPRNGGRLQASTICL